MDVDETLKQALEALKHAVYLLRKFAEKSGLTIGEHG